MKVFTGQQIKEADNFMMLHEPISSIDLMERVSEAIAQWIVLNVSVETPLFFIIGKGNNGGDGLAIARILSCKGYTCRVHVLFVIEYLSSECRINADKLPASIPVTVGSDFIVEKQELIIDALLGTGVRDAIHEPVKSAVDKINLLTNKVISIDMPSGMKTEFENIDQTIVHADITLTIQFPKLAMLFPESGENCGKIIIIPIGIHDDYIVRTTTLFNYSDKAFVSNLLLERTKFAHKGTYGHALLICGSENMIGASVLATASALRSGCGLVTTHIPEQERLALQITCPSALLDLDTKSYFSSLPMPLSKYTAVGIGCGLGQKQPSIEAFEELLKNIQSPLIIDADALNILAAYPVLNQYIPAGSILTPHVGELKRLIGNWKDEAEKIDKVRRFAATIQSIVIVKGAYTMICLPDGICYFNSTGNPGMAKGGCGDVLTGLLTGLCARGYKVSDAAILGVYIHGLAGDLASAAYGEEGLCSYDLIEYLPKAMLSIMTITD